MGNRPPEVTQIKGDCSGSTWAVRPANWIHDQFFL